MTDFELEYILHTFPTISYNSSEVSLVEECQVMICTRITSDEGYFFKIYADFSNAEDF